MVRSQEQEVTLPHYYRFIKGSIGGSLGVGVVNSIRKPTEIVFLVLCVYLSGPVCQSSNPGSDDRVDNGEHRWGR